MNTNLDNRLGQVTRRAVVERWVTARRADRPNSSSQLFRAIPRRGVRSFGSLAPPGRGELEFAGGLTNDGRCPQWNRQPEGSRSCFGSNPSVNEDT